IPLLAPPKLAPRLRSLPPILYMRGPHPMTGYSKAPRGLSVQLRVYCVFTVTTTSPSPWSRQRSSRYTIRAGRNFARSSVSGGRRLYLYLGSRVALLAQGVQVFGQLHNLQEPHLCQMLFSEHHLANYRKRLELDRFAR